MLLEHGFKETLGLVSFAAFAVAREGQQLEHTLACFIGGQGGIRRWPKVGKGGTASESGPVARCIQKVTFQRR